jgi:Na+-transporting methylmalonyl-CoA/oxaloacetate decarboxylase gamma subunit
MTKWMRKYWCTGTPKNVTVKKTCTLSWGRTIVKFDKAETKSILFVKWPKNDFSIDIGKSSDGSLFELMVNVGGVRSVLSSFKNEEDAKEALDALFDKWTHKRSREIVKGACKAAVVLGVLFLVISMISAGVSTFKAVSLSSGAQAVQEQKQTYDPSMEEKIKAITAQLNEKARQNAQQQAPQPTQAAPSQDINDAFANGK